MRTALPTKPRNMHSWGRCMVPMNHPPHGNRARQAPPRASTKCRHAEARTGKQEANAAKQRAGRATLRLVHRHWCPMCPSSKRRNGPVRPPLRILGRERVCAPTAVAAHQRRRESGEVSKMSNFGKIKKIPGHQCISLSLPVVCLLFLNVDTLGHLNP